MGILLLPVVNAHSRPVLDAHEPRSCLALLPSGLSPIAGPWYGADQWIWFTSQHYRVGKIRIRVVNVFNTSRPGENTWYARLANFIHIKTVPAVIRNELLFKSGEPVNARNLYETERNLRVLPFVRIVIIEPDGCHGHVVNVRVIEKDAWTLKANFQFTHVGGQSEYHYKIKDTDFLGLGKIISVGWEKTFEQSGTLFAYEDPAIMGTRWTGLAQYDHFSDGFLKELTVGRPFYRDRDPWALTFTGSSQQENLDFFENGTLTESIPTRINDFSVDYGRLLGFSHDTGERFFVGWSRRSESYGTPSLIPGYGALPLALIDRTENGPTLGWQLFQDRYRSFENIRLIDRVEDYNLGWTVNANWSYDPSWLGSLGSSSTLNLSVDTGTRIFGHDLLLASASWEARRQANAWQNEVGEIQGTYYNQMLPYQTLVLHGDYQFEVNPEPDNLLYIGGIQGLRGYPNFFRLGTRLWSGTIEDRIVTPIQFWHTFVLGFVVYADWARIEELSPSRWSQTYQDVGGGIRIGDLRSAYGQVYYLTIAFPTVHAPGVPASSIVIGDIVNF